MTNKKLIALVKYTHNDIKYYINIIDSNEFPTETEKDYPFNIDRKIIFFNEINFLKLLDVDLDINPTNLDDLIDYTYDMNFIKKALTLGGLDKQAIIITTLNLMQDALVLLQERWKKKYPKFIYMADYFTFNYSIDEFINICPFTVLDLMNELIEIDKLINNNSRMIDDSSKFISLPFEPMFL